MSCKTGLIGHQRTKIFILTSTILGMPQWEKISEITDIKPPNAAYSEDDATTLEDTDKTVVTAGPREHSNVEVTMLALSGDEMQKRLYLSNYHGKCERFKIVRPDALATTSEFSGYIKDFGEETDPKKKTRLKLVITVSGAVGKYDQNGYITPDFITAGYSLIPIITGITIAPSAITTAVPTAIVTITFNQPIITLDLADITAEHGVLSNLQTTDNVVYTATFTANAGIALSTGKISIAAGVYKNADGRAGLAAESAAYSVETV